MNPKLREYLKRHGVPDHALDKLDRGEVPDDDDSLRKNRDPVLEKVKECDELLRQIKESIDRIVKEDKKRADMENFVISGAPIHNGARVDLRAMDLKGSIQ